MLALLQLLAVEDAATEGKKVITGMLIVGLIFLGVIVARRDDALAAPPAPLDLRLAVGASSRCGRAPDRDGHVPLHRHRGVDAAAARARATRYADALAEHGACCARRSRGTAASRWTRRATRSSSPSPTRLGRACAAAADGAGARSRAARSACAWACTRASRSSTDEGYVGIDVHRAARIAAAGHGGQVARLAGDARPRRRSTAARPRRAPAQGPGRARALYQLGDGRVPAAARRCTATNLPVAGDAAHRPRARARRGRGAAARRGRGWSR